MGFISKKIKDLKDKINIAEKYVKEGGINPELVRQKTDKLKQELRKYEIIEKIFTAIRKRTSIIIKVSIVIGLILIFLFSYFYINRKYNNLMLDGHSHVHENDFELALKKYNSARKYNFKSYCQGSRYSPE